MRFETGLREEFRFLITIFDLKITLFYEKRRKTEHMIIMGIPNRYTHFLHTLLTKKSIVL